MAAAYDEKKPVTLKGIVTKFDWTNPHVFLFLDVDKFFALLDHLPFHTSDSLHNTGDVGPQHRLCLHAF